MSERRCPKCHGKGTVEHKGYQQVELLAGTSVDLVHEQVYCFGPIAGEFSAGAWGSVEDGYLVLVGRTGKGWLFQPEGPLEVSYVQEKLKVDPLSGNGVAHLIGRMTGREVVGEIHNT